MSLNIQIAWVDDPDGDGRFYRLCVSGSDTYLAILPLDKDAPLHEILRAAAEEATPPALTPLQQQIAALLAEDPPPTRQAISDTLGCSLSAVDQVARRLGTARQSRRTDIHDRARVLAADPAYQRPGGSLDWPALAEALGVSRQRVQQILSLAPRKTPHD